ncbi:CusA/CzcA family heavy metal efflux RND transporter [Candidatus Peregrinibacteria bacterium]|nr:MAG: CusA/CzcA family heavy metal efflux RND transporter [Candidatus Peregrinibacteria bacterium]
MINELIKIFLHNRFVTLMVFIALTIVSVIAIQNTPIDALPDLSENQVIVMTQWTGQNPQNIEDQITFPLTVNLQGLAGVKDVRGMSQLGISMVTVIFEDNVDKYFARDRVAERLNTVRNQLPFGVTPVLGPDASGLGHVYLYTLESDVHTLTELRSIQDFTVRYALQSVKGVAEVASVGGYVKTFQVVIDPLKLEKFGISLVQIVSEIKNGNNNVSGEVIDTGAREIAIQGVGFFKNIKDMASVVVGKKPNGTPIVVSDIGFVRESGMSRRGILADHEEEKVGGFIVMRYEQNPLKVIEAIKAKIIEIEPSLPEGVTIKSFYDRTALIQGAVSTLSEILVEELIITAIVLGLFLMHVRATLITCIALVVGVLVTFLCMYIFNIPSNIMSLGGIGVAIGTMVDAAIVISENAYDKLLQKKPKNNTERLKIVMDASLEVGGPIVFAIFIIIISFIPIFALTGMEGKLFHPLAWTNVFSMVGTLVAALLLVPTLCYWFLRGKLKRDDEIPVNLFFMNQYKPLLKKALHYKKTTVGLALSLFIIASMFSTQIGSEFMPPLEEGAIFYMPMTLPDVSERRAQEILLETNRIIATFPEVQQVVGKAGRANTATDPAPLAMLETFITLKPKDEWREGMTKNKLVSQINKAIRIDNVWNGFTQPIIGRIDMISTGIRAQIGIKIFGDDSLKIEKIALEIEEIMENVRGASGVAAIRTTGLRYLNINLDSDKLAFLGVKRGDALSTIAAGVAGQKVGTTIQGREQYAIEVRLAHDYRESVEDMKALKIPSIYGSHVTLGSVAHISLEDGPAVINSENGMIRGAVQMNVVGKDLMSFVEEGRQILDEKLELPSGYRIEWAGQYTNQLAAKKKLQTIVPAVLLLILFVLYVTYKDLGMVAIVTLTIPLGLIGGFFALFFTGTNFSVAVAVGFIALFGNVVETGMVILVYLQQEVIAKLQEAKQAARHITSLEIEEAVMSGATRRMRPVLMTAFTSIIGLIPMLMATGVGAEVTKPLALVLVFGLISSIAMTLLVVPVLFTALREWQYIYKT